MWNSLLWISGLVLFVAGPALGIATARFHGGAYGFAVAMIITSLGFGLIMGGL
jgi:hypothetical protein